MPKKQKTAVEETQELAQKLQDDMVKDFSFPDEKEENPFDAVPVEEPKTEIEKKVEETPKEEAKEDKPVFDQEKFKEDLVSEIDKRLPKADTKEEKEEKKDAIKEYLDKAKAEGRNPTWEEALAFVAEEGSNRAYERIKAEQAAEQEKARVQEEEREQIAEVQKKADEERVKAFNQVIDDELDELYNNNKLPRIKNKDDAKDPGVIARKALFQTMLDVNEKRKEEGKPAILSVSRIYSFYYKPPTAQRAGADAPVSMGQGASEASDPDDYSYTDLKKEQRKWGFWKSRR